MISNRHLLIKEDASFIEKQYLDLMKKISTKGNLKHNRTGTDTLSLFGESLRHSMNVGFPLLTTKKMFFRGIFEELIWFLNGDTKLKPLLEKGVKIWLDDAFSKYQKGNWTDMTKKEFEVRIMNDPEFEKKWGDLGPIYGHQWRKFGEKGNEYSNHNDYSAGVDQIVNLIKDLTNSPDSRRMIVNAWNPADIHLMTLPPCHYGFQVITRELTEDEVNYFKENESVDVSHLGLPSPIASNALPLPTRAISLLWTQRSVDTFLGLPFNIASYGLLLELLAMKMNMVPEDLICSLGDTHLYVNHLDQVQEQLSRDPDTHPSPTLKFSDGCSSKNLEDLKYEDVKLTDYSSFDQIKAQIST